MVNNIYIKKLISDIFMITILLIVTISCHNVVLARQVEENSIVSSMSKYSLNLLSSVDSIYLVSDDYAKNDMSPSRIEVENNTKLSSEYNLYLKLDKNSTIDTSILKILVNDKEYVLDNLYEYEQDNYKYYKIYNSIIDEYDIISFKIWVSSSLTDVIYGSKLIYSFKAI